MSPRPIRCLRCGMTMLHHEGGIPLGQSKQHVLTMHMHYVHHHPEVTLPRQESSELAAVTATGDDVEALALAINDAINHGSRVWAPLPGDRIRQIVEDGARVRGITIPPEMRELLAKFEARYRSQPRTETVTIDLSFDKL